MGLVTIYIFSEVFRKRPGVSFALSLILFSLAGIPPLAGFICKLYVFMAIINSGLIYLAVVGALASVIGAFYYLRLIYIIYFMEKETKLDARMLFTHICLLFAASSAIVIGTYNLLGVEPLTRAAAQSLIY